MTQLRSRPLAERRKPQPSPPPGAVAPFERDELRGRPPRLPGGLVLVCAAAIQLSCSSRVQEDNLLSTALATGVVAARYRLRTRTADRFRAQPISALILLFYTTTSTSGALLVKTPGMERRWSDQPDWSRYELFAVLFATAAGAAARGPDGTCAAPSSCKRSRRWLASTNVILQKVRRDGLADRLASSGCLARLGCISVHADRHRL